MFKRKQRNAHRGARRPVPVLGRLLRTCTRKITAGTLALLMVGGVAWAAYVITAGVNGTISAGNLQASWTPNYAVTVTPGATNVGSCGTATIDASGQMQLAGITNVLPGDSCSFTSQVKLSVNTNVPSSVSGIALPSLPAHFGVTLDSGCGASMTTGGSTANVTFTITAGPSVAPFENGTLTGTSNGVQIMPTTQFSGTCTATPVAS